jgi:glycosyltransferase involved in cell wall biosynthesis
LESLKLLVNGLSMGGGGGLTVGVELSTRIARLRPDWQVALALVVGSPLHEEVRGLALPDNCQLLWAPPSTARVSARLAYERRELAQWAHGSKISAVVQLNGMIIPGIGIPTLAHCQDPWPYRPEAWDGRGDAAKAFLKRRANRAAFKKAAFVSWTSGYLRDLMCRRMGISPPRGEVIYNGIPDPWIAEAAAGLPPYEGRPMRIVTISNVNQYKQQEMVIRAMPALRATPGLEQVEYRVAGECPPAYAAHLRGVADSFGVGGAVFIEGRVSRERVVELFSTARCFVLMSKCESFGIPAIEAMAFGTPVVAADCCAIPEVCGEAACLVGMDDNSGLVEALRKVLLQPKYAAELRAKGAATLARYSWDKSAEQMAAAIESVAA